MRQNQETFYQIIFLGIVIFLTIFTMMPQQVSTDEEPLSEFSTGRALRHISEIAKSPHYTGSVNHRTVADYIQKELEKLNLKSEIQEGTTLSDWGNLVKSRNIITKIKGSNSTKAVLLLSHYDSAPHSASRGAADDASGIATILEGIRAFIQNNTPHTNDIIIVFTDAEELGLNGAALFVTEHQYAKDIGIVINFEARGTAGPSYMLMETNGGNAGLVNGFSKAGSRFPVANSLMYSIYKMMPNDTDLTVFREQGDIPGYNFAFIDDHFNYHTAQDDLQHLDHRSLKHQGSYLMPLLTHFSNADLNTVKSADDYVYFNIPFAFVTYPFSWIFLMLLATGLLFLFFVFIGIGRRSLIVPAIGKGFLIMLGTIASAAITAYLGWKIILAVYPGYGEILHGFTYNGHMYIPAFVFMSLALSFLFYFRTTHDSEIYSYSVGPQVLWLIICSCLAIYLPGASFFIIPVLCSVVMLGIYTILQRSWPIINLILMLPSIFVFVPLILMLPVGLGLKMLVASATLTALVFGLLLPIFGSMKTKPVWSGVFFVISIGFLISAHLKSDFEPGKAKPNSLVYILDADSQKALWATYDNLLDEWTQRKLGDSPQTAKSLDQLPLFSKYNSKFTFSSDAAPIALEKPAISFEMDSTIGEWRHLKIRISPNRKVNRYDIFAGESLAVHNLRANGATALGQKGSLYKRKGKKLLSCYLVDNEPLMLEFTIRRNAVLNLELLESSFDLSENPLLEIDERKDWMLPKPFVLTDAVILRQRIRPTPKTLRPILEPVNTISPDTIAQGIQLPAIDTIP